jgi:outer membrane protein TolC
MKLKYTLLLFWMSFLSGYTQDNQLPTNYSLKEAVDYAVQNSFNVKNSLLDQKIANSQISSQVMNGLPQVSGNIDFVHYFQVQNTILENTPTLNGNPNKFYSPAIPNGQVLNFGLSLQNQFLPSLTGTQVIFDQSFFTSLKASNVFKELSSLNVNRTKIDVALAVTKAYYSVLVNGKQLSFIDVSLSRLDSAYKEATSRYNNGLARKIEVDRAEVTLNNLKEDRLNVLRTVNLSKALLKFQMNLPITAEVILTDSLHENLLSDAFSLPEETRANYGNRIEYAIQQTQIFLDKTNVQNAKSGYLPKLLGIGSFAYNPEESYVPYIFTQGNRWIYYSYVGLRLQVPITGAIGSQFLVQQRKLNLEKSVNNKMQLERSIDLEVQQSLINLSNSLESLKIQRRNMDLAQKNLQVSRAEYKEGIAIALEVTNAESALKEAQTNYYNSLYNALVSKADYEKAIGNLYK